MKKIVLLGSSGYLGKVLQEYFHHSPYYSITTVSRTGTPDYIWDGRSFGTWVEALKEADVIINLSGKSVNCRYTTQNKRKILDSRLITTHLIGKALVKHHIRPKCWVNMSSATIYNDSYTQKNGEDSNNIGYDFSMTVCKEWEAAAQCYTDYTERLVLARTSIVLGPNGGAFKMLKTLSRLGLGGNLGTGQQKMSWIHELDFARAIEYALVDHTVKGPYNIVAPEVVSNQNFMKVLSQYTQLKFQLPSPSWLIKLGAFFLRTEPELILKSRNVFPKKLMEQRFNFLYPTLRTAFKAL